ncbi:hypothetical protein A3I46_00380 [Candidatus Kaiserbacteria bacterium RIFCSPLOWO2_02_FULL_54_13]|uniref:Vitamin K epoxide reductase domain-containing protein n=1 Tax=Candidatus Kaiserbacteria bacterium RIFCSPHIGHO2_02_FULL_54_22 TaxID=1798495 RepID=A0A1F6DK14_9BACT|nr:MAG: Vitamin K epoxide reductase [Parcubacteria group bacterium GW2011_GWA1_54_9]OGG61765.1 MAG: hypothetical protein A3C19_00740 [Candidatus Kaiserbacteria bacterium RIFCSPHIGHO2_02_FULL_54_22]OGG83244.1 MAG: hypothetical protein A3I46_00380 [Candidatus Kaiserbacteria bacterium RIFCSPLOWO2_02_FULL_54_13]OGG89890.1 MAG: hypothetical protein A3G12_02895 [Candidatus Kaiserbacteria bacterium RIFCSPLOWO2_12_FULL_54_10]
MNPVRDKNFLSSGRLSAGISNGMKRAGVVLILVLSFAGIADSAYLAQHKANGTPLICNIQNLSDCNIVANSQYSYIFGIPIAELGVLFYSIMFVLAALELALFDRLLRRVLQAFSLVGLLISIFSTIVQVFVINALCIYCLASALISLLIFVLATLIEPIKGTKGQTLPPPLTPPRPPFLSMPPAS